MQPILDYFLLVVNELVEILNSLSFNGGFSILYYLLGAIIIGFIIKLIKGGSNEFEQNTNFLNSRIISTGVSHYSQNNRERKEQIIRNEAFSGGFTSGYLFGEKDRKGATYFVNKYYKDV